MALRSVMVTALVLLTAPAWAHKPTETGEGHSTQGDALRLEDVDQSTVTYHEAACTAPQLWLTFHAEENQQLFLQLGTPQLDYLERYRPSVAVLAPGLPALQQEVPFQVPKGMGVLVFSTEAVGAPRRFHEPFTQTDSWILVEQRLTMSGGDGFIVAWDPENRSGKFWMAVGELESFGFRDLVNAPTWIRDARRFHEVLPSTDLLSRQQDCALPASTAGGCGGTPVPLPLGLGLLLLSRAQRRRPASLM